MIRGSTVFQVRRIKTVEKMRIIDLRNLRQMHRRNSLL